MLAKRLVEDALQMHVRLYGSQRYSTFFFIEKVMWFLTLIYLTILMLASCLLLHLLEQANYAVEPLYVMVYVVLAISIMVLFLHRVYKRLVKNKIRARSGSLWFNSMIWIPALMILIWCLSYLN